MMKLPLNFCYVIFGMGLIFMALDVANAKPKAGLTPPEDMKDDIPRSLPLTENVDSQTSTQKPIMDDAEIQEMCSKFDQDCAACLKNPKCHFSLYKNDVTKCSNEPMVTDIVEEIFVEEKCPVKPVDKNTTKSSTESSNNATVTSTPISSSTSTFTTTAASNQTSSTTTTTTSTSAETTKR